MASDAWGIDEGYEDAAGDWHDTTPQTRAAILAAMGWTDETASPRDIKVVYQGSSPNAAFAGKSRKPSRGSDNRPSRGSDNEPPRGSDNGPPRGKEEISRGEEKSWRGKLVLEDGAVLKLQGRLPDDLPLGYHEFWPSDEHSPRTLLIVTPGQCVLPPDGDWGWSAQLYAARSAESWGIGDLADLARLAGWSAAQSAKLLLINPLSAAAPVTPQQGSPYYPSSRRFLNPLYLRVEQVPGADRFTRELEPLIAAGRALNDERRIDRDAVFRLKRQALEMIWSGSTPGPAFEKFCARQGAALEQFATYCVLAERHGANWRRWPADFQVAGHAAVGRFAADQRARVRFHQWQQWLLDQQLSRAAGKVALVQDLSIGIDPGGADAWAWRDLLADGCSVGAPPDLYNTQGQDWGLPPFVPHKLREAGYAPLIETLRATLRHGGGLRIDHVLGLFRLWWVPHGFGAAAGAFVRYQVDEMLAIVALESHRSGAFVVGEDLGTVEEGVREKLADHHVLSYRLFWFEDEPPATYPPLSMAAVTTHDLPTVAGLWSGQDLAEQEQLGLAPNEEAALGIRDKLARMADLSETERMDTVIESAYRLLAKAPSYLATACLDDALAISERPNIPNTTDDRRPNWSLALPGGLEALEASGLAERIAAVMRKRVMRGRGAASPGAATASDGPGESRPSKTSNAASAERRRPR
jgi:4-alpha-glucanotransferase